MQTHTHTIPSDSVILNKHSADFSVHIHCYYDCGHTFFPSVGFIPSQNYSEWWERNEMLCCVVLKKTTIETEYIRDYDGTEKHLYVVFNPLTITTLHNLSSSTSQYCWKLFVAYFQFGIIPFLANRMHFVNATVPIFPVPSPIAVVVQTLTLWVVVKFELKWNSWECI